MMKKLALAMILGGVMIPMAVHATEETRKATVDKAVVGRALSGLLPIDDNCGNITENATVNINFNSYEKDVEAASSAFEKHMTDIKAIAKDLKLEKMEVQSMNYNLYPQNNNGMVTQWQMSGSISFQILPATRAKELMKFLVDKGMQPNLNVNAYRNGACK